MKYLLLLLVSLNSFATVYECDGSKFVIEPVVMNVSTIIETVDGRPSEDTAILFRIVEENRYKNHEREIHVFDHRIVEFKDDGEEMKMNTYYCDKVYE